MSSNKPASVTNDIFMKRFDEYVALADKYVNKYFCMAAGDNINREQKNIYEAMLYSLQAGGKRIRPVLALAVADYAADLTGRDRDCLRDSVAPFAAAIEMIHTYSLIHDDLPCMDDDDFRRGKPSNHKKFGEAHAVLAGDGLLNIAFEILNIGLVERISSFNAEISNLYAAVCGTRQGTKLSALSDPANPFSCISGYARAMKLVGECSGCGGMIGGQIIDIEAEPDERELSLEQLNRLHELKTGALIRAAILSSAFACGIPEDICDKLDKYAIMLGRSFQITDDILDVESTSEDMGKTVGKDERDSKSTYVTLYGKERAKAEVAKLTGEMTGIFVNDPAGEFFVDFAVFIQNRRS